MSITVTGSADAPADWVEVSLSVEGKGVTCQEALGVCSTSSQAVVEKLAAIQVLKEDVRLGPTEIGPNAYAQMIAAGQGGNGNEGARQTVRRDVAVRLAPADPQSLYERICLIVDTAADAGATIKTAGPVQQVWSQGAVVAFGVSDPKSLRAKAIANGLAAAKDVAEVTVASCGRKLGEIVGVRVSEGGELGLIAGITGMGLTASPGRAACNVSLTVTYRLQ